MAHQQKMILCPYCGTPQPASAKCMECGGLFEPLSRQATQIAMGPWYLRDRQNPFRPGCSYEVLQRQIQQGKVGPNSVVRGPTTRQFWALARNVPGVAHLVGYCHQCGHHVHPDDPRCDHCGQRFRRVTQRNELGLMYPNQEVAAKARRRLNRELEKLARESQDASDDASPGKSQAMPTSPTARPDGVPGEDLFDQVMGLGMGTLDAEQMASDQDADALVLFDDEKDLKLDGEDAPAPPAKAPATLPEPEDDRDDQTQLTAERQNPGPTQIKTLAKRNHRLSLLIAAMVLINLLVLTLLIVVVLNDRTHRQADTTTSQQDQTPGDPMTELYTTTPTVNDDWRYTNDPKTTNPTAAGDHDGSSPIPAGPPVQLPAALSASDRAIASARELQRQGKYEQALTMLRQTTEALPMRERTPALEEALRQAQMAVNRDKAAKFLDLD